MIFIILSIKKQDVHSQKITVAFPYYIYIQSTKREKKIIKKSENGVVFN